MRLSLVPCLCACITAATSASAAHAQRFEPVQPELFGAGATLSNAWADFDNDGDLDLFIGFNGAPNRLYASTNGVFADVAVRAGVALARSTRAAAWGDYDADGNVDLLIGTAPGEGGVLTLYRNTGGTFVDATVTAGLRADSGGVRQLAWVDFDGDGDLDLFVGLRDRPNRLYLNEGGRFRDVAAERGIAETRRTVGAVWADFDQDGDLDVAVANMDGDVNTLFRNQGGRFTVDSATIALGGRTRERTSGTVRICAGDVDGDGWLDLFFANYGPNGLFRNTGQGGFTDVSAAWGVAVDGRYDACAFADIDNDGHLDVYVNGTVTGGVSYRDYLFRNTGTRFSNITPANIEALKADHGAQWADFDRDGAVDLSLTGVGQDGMHHLLRNHLAPDAAARSLSVLVTDANGRLTRAGAEIRVYARGTRELLAMRLVDGGSGYDSQNAGPEHLGLRRAGPVDVEVVFPMGGRRVTERVENVNPAAHRGRNLEVRVSR